MGERDGRRVDRNGGLETDQTFMEQRRHQDSRNIAEVEDRKDDRTRSTTRLE